MVEVRVESGAGAPMEKKGGAIRRCAATRERKRKESLLRLALDPDRRPFVDVLGRAPGRGIYVQPDRAVLEEALSPKGLGRLFKGQARPLEDDEIRAIVESTVRRIEERILELVSLARRAGKLVIGMEPVLDKGGELAIVARDLSERSEGLVGGIAAPVLRIGTKVELGRRLGREETGVVAIQPSVFADRAMWEAERLTGLLSTSTKTASRGRVRSARKKEQD